MCPTVSYYGNWKDRRQKIISRLPKKIREAHKRPKIGISQTMLGKQNNSKILKSYVPEQ